MFLSIVICTRNRAEQLGSSLRAISLMHRPDSFELVVVDNGSTDNTATVIRDFASEASYPVTLVFEGNPGLGNARNAGWRRARGDIIAFTDDDCYVDRDFAHAVIAAFKIHNSLGFLGGRILLHDPTDLRITIQESTENLNFPPGKLVPAGAIQGANFAFRRSALEAVGGFDPLLGAGTPFPSEDVEMVSRLSAQGWGGLYTPDPVVYHHHGRKTAADAEKLRRGYDYGRGAYYMAIMLHQGLRLQTLRFWFWHIRHQDLRRTQREISGLIGYLQRSVWRPRQRGSTSDS